MTNHTELPLPATHYNAYSDGSEPLYTEEHMRDYAAACVETALNRRADSEGAAPSSKAVATSWAEEEALHTFVTPDRTKPSEAAVAAPVELDELRMLIVRLARSLSKAAPDHALPAQALDYLDRKGLKGSPLRDASAQVVQASLTDEPYPSPAEWIDLNTLMPEPECYVLTWDGKKVGVDWWGSIRHRGDGVTHWLPFVAPPGAGRMYGMHSYHPLFVRVGAPGKPRPFVRAGDSGLPSDLPINQGVRATDSGEVKS